MKSMVLLPVSIEELKAEFSTVVKAALESQQQPAQPQQSEIRLLSYKEATRLLGVSDTTLRQYVNEGIIPAHRIRGNKAVRFKEHELLQALEPVKSL